MMDVRVGSGFDSHRLKAGRPFRLCGVAVDWPRGPWGHSDGDPLAHALADAVLGGAGLGDIGEHFPDNDPAWKDCPGERLLALAVAKVLEAGFDVVNADLTVFLERPRLAPVKEAVRGRVAGILGISGDRVCVKAKTAEGFGAIGRGDSVGAHAVVLLRRKI